MQLLSFVFPTSKLPFLTSVHWMFERSYQLCSRNYMKSWKLIIWLVLLAGVVEKRNEIGCSVILAFEEEKPEWIFEDYHSTWPVFRFENRDWRVVKLDSARKKKTRMLVVQCLQGTTWIRTDRDFLEISKPLRLDSTRTPFNTLLHGFNSVSASDAIDSSSLKYLGEKIEYIYLAKTSNLNLWKTSYTIDDTCTKYSMNQCQGPKMKEKLDFRTRNLHKATN